MNYIDFPEANTTFVRPADMQDTCGDLKVLRAIEFLGEKKEEFPVIISCWQLTDDDLENLMKNGSKVWLHVTGNGMPPVRIHTDDPFINLKRAEPKPSPLIIVPGGYESKPVAHDRYCPECRSTNLSDVGSVHERCNECNWQTDYDG